MEESSLRPRLRRRLRSGCQRRIAREIQEADADYVLALLKTDTHKPQCSIKAAGWDHHYLLRLCGFAVAAGFSTGC